MKFLYKLLISSPERELTLQNRPGWQECEIQESTAPASKYLHKICAPKPEQSKTLNFHWERINLCPSVVVRPTSAGRCGTTSRGKVRPTSVRRCCTTSRGIARPTSPQLQFSMDVFANVATLPNHLDASVAVRSSSGCPCYFCSFA